MNQLKEKYLLDLIKNMFNINYDRDDNNYEIPDNLFGIFASIHRQRLNINNPTNNDNVHGCIGYFNMDGMTRENIIKKGFDVSYSACWEDNRSSHFSDSILFDPSATLQIYYMKKPYYIINKENGMIEELNKKFNNSNYGIIAIDNRTKERATYLPNVFPNKNFNNIKNDIIVKASYSSKNKSQYTFYAYTCDIYEISFSDLLSKPQLTLHIESFIDFINNYFESNHNFIPYSMNINNKINIQMNQNVRNIASIYDYLFLCKYLNKLPEKNSIIYNKIINNIQHYIIKQQKKNNMQQAGTFLLLVLKDFYKNSGYNYTPNINIYYNLLSDNKVNLLNQQFELPQILIMLSIIKPNKNIISKFLHKFYKTINNYNKIDINNIFFYNWFAKLLFEIYINNTLSNNNQFILKIKDILSNKIIEIVKEYNNDIETNYMAVAFEGLSALYTMDKDSIKYKYIYYLFIELEKRRNKYSLYTFLNGSARIDITTHVLYGFYYLLYSKNI